MKTPHRNQLELVGPLGGLGLQAFEFRLECGDLLGDGLLRGLDLLSVLGEIALLGLQLVNRFLQATQFGCEVGLLLSLGADQFLACLQSLLQALPVVAQRGEFRLPLLAELLLLPGAIGLSGRRRREQLLRG